MTRLGKYLSQLSEVDTAAAEQARDTFLEELEIPSEWEVHESDVEIAQEGPEDWFLVSFEHRSAPDHRALIFLLEGSHELQVYLESADDTEWSDTTQNPHEITAIIANYQ